VPGVLGSARVGEERHREKQGSGNARDNVSARCPRCGGDTEPLGVPCCYFPASSRGLQRAAFQGPLDGVLLNCPVPPRPRKPPGLCPRLRRVEEQPERGESDGNGEQFRLSRHDRAVLAGERYSGSDG